MKANQHTAHNTSYYGYSMCQHWWCSPAALVHLLSFISTESTVQRSPGLSVPTVTVGMCGSYYTASWACRRDALRSGIDNTAILHQGWASAAYGTLHAHTMHVFIWHNSGHHLYQWLLLVDSGNVSEGLLLGQSLVFLLSALSSVNECFRSNYEYSYLRHTEL